jgi:hypothetical protein
MPYLAAPASKVDVWRDRLGEHAKPRMGLVWGGNPRKELRQANGVDRDRSVAFDRLEPLLEIVGCHFYSLQKGDDAVKQLRESAWRERVIDLTSKHLTGPWQKQIDWIDEQINRLWKLRGPCPGLGSALSALEDGFNGTLFALTLSASLSETDDPWEITDKIFRKKLSAPSGAPKLTAMLRKRWEHLHKEAPKLAALLRLLSRFELTRDQAVRCGRT